MKIPFVAAFCFLIFSCSDKKTYYKYQGVTVTRIDGDGESTFFYGDFKDDTSGHAFVKAEYYGFNNGLDALIQFKKDSTVEIVHLGGEHLIPSGSLGSKIRIGEYLNDKTDWQEMFRYPNVVRVSNVTELEREWHAMYKSKVMSQKP